MSFVVVIIDILIILLSQKIWKKKTYYDALGWIML